MTNLEELQNELYEIERRISELREKLNQLREEYEENIRAISKYCTDEYYEPQVGQKRKWSQIE
jgi:hypothetical protein